MTLGQGEQVLAIRAQVALGLELLYPQILLQYEEGQNREAAAQTVLARKALGSFSTVVNVPLGGFINAAEISPYSFAPRDSYILAWGIEDITDGDDHILHVSNSVTFFTLALGGMWMATCSDKAIDVETITIYNTGTAVGLVRGFAIVAEGQAT